MSYTKFHPRWHRARMSTYWWLRGRRHLAFVARETSSVFVAWAVGVTIAAIAALGRGPAAYASFEAWLARPVVVGLNALAFAFVVIHAVTWFALAPRAMIVHLRGKRLPDRAVSGANYAAWAIASAVVALVVLWRR